MKTAVDVEPRLQPQTLDAEQSVLGAILLDNAALTKAKELLTHEDFYKTAHRRTFAAMVSLAERGSSIDNVTLAAELEARGQLIEAGGAAYLAELVAAVPSTAGIASHSKLVKECAERRRMICEAEAVLDDLYAGRPLAETPSGNGVLLRLADVTPCAIRWLWRRRIPRGKLTVIDGDPGLGKSLLTLDLAARVTSAQSMPDGGASDSGPSGVVLLTDEDDAADTIRPRLEAARADVDKIVILRAIRERGDERGPHLGDVEALRNAIQTVDAGLVIIDPVMSFVPEERNSHKDQDIRRCLAPLALLAAETGVAIIIIRHLNKSAEKGVLYRGGGSIGIIGAARAGLLVASDPEDAEGQGRVLAPTKSNLGPPSSSLKFRIVATASGVPVIEWMGESAMAAHDLLHAAGEDQDGHSEVEEAVAWLRGVLANGPVESKILEVDAKGAGLAWTTVKRAKRLTGVIAQKQAFNGPWTWRLPAEGDQP